MAKQTGRRRTPRGLSSPDRATVASGFVTGLLAGIAARGFRVDELLERADSKYALVLYSAKRARQINAYYAQLQEGLLEYVGPLVDSEVHEKPMSIALREINEGLLTSTPTEE